ETSEQLDVEPAKYFVVVTKREKRACKCCQEGGVTAAAAPARIVEKGLASDRVVIDTVVAKYSDHLPLYRQSAMLDREAGVEISRATLDGWVMRVGELLIPIVSVMRRELLGGSYLQADETTVDVQMHDGSGHNHQFFEAAKLDPGDVVAVRMVAWIDELFGIDAEARERKLDHAGRHALRLERATPWLATIGEEIETVRTSALPSSALGRAAKYTFSLWRKLTRFLEYPELELSNNLAENSMRPVALGRKNWIHVGSKDAGPKVAAIASIVETCRRLKIPIRGYLTGVMPGIADVPIQRLADLTPAAWAARQQ
ncbi:MAG: transposase, partial [Candidatus Solibacter sp.]